MSRSASRLHAVAGISACVALVFALAPASAHAWGFDGHRRLAANMHEPFPQGSCLRAWLAQVTSQFSYTDKACDPDRWRNTDSNEWPRHYLDIDYENPITAYPREWPAVEARFGKYALANGTVPFRAEEMYGLLVADMKAGNGAQALDRVAHLSHYVTDAFSPLHDTKDQPQFPGPCPDCLHLRYESEILDVSTQINAITTAMRGYYGTLGKADPRNHIFDAVIAGHPVAQKIIADDFAANGSNEALYTNTKDATARRWGDALTMMASFIGTAWVEAGKPKLAGMPSGCSTDVAQGQLVLVGYPLPPPQPVSDAGTGNEVDAGTTTGGDDAGAVIGFDAGVTDGGGQNVDELGCAGCGGPMAAVFPLAMLAVVLPARRRRERRK